MKIVKSTNLSSHHYSSSDIIIDSDQKIEKNLNYLPATMKTKNDIVNLNHEYADNDNERLLNALDNDYNDENCALIGVNKTFAERRCESFDG